MTTKELKKLTEAKEWIEGADHLAFGLQMAIKDVPISAEEPLQMGRVAALAAIIDALRRCARCRRSISCRRRR